MRRIILAFVLLATTAAPVGAESSFGFAWNPAVPLGDTADYAGGFAWRGASMEWRNYVASDLTVGGMIGWNTLTDDFEGTVTDGNLTVTGKRWNYLNALPIHLTAYKYFSTDRRAMRWYAGLGAGANWMEYSQEVGIYAFKDQGWQFAVAPEVGVRMPWHSFVGYVGVRYHHAFAASGLGAQSWIDFKIGFGLD